MNMLFSERASDPETKAAVKPRMAPDINMKIMVTVKDMSRNDQKFLEHASKNPANENLSLPFFRLSKSPPVKKEFTIKDIVNRNRNPEMRDENVVLNTGPRSRKTSGSKPSASLSVIMLLPKADFIAPLNGMTIRETRISENNHKSKTPFHDLRVRVNPEPKELHIFIKTVLQ